MRTINKTRFDDLKSMSGDVMRSKLMTLTTVELADFLLDLVDHKRSLKGNIQGSPLNKILNSDLARVIRTVTTELNSRQQKLQGF